VRHAQWLHKGRPGHRQELANKSSRGIRI
jgi:hypothetical protein